MSIIPVKGKVGREGKHFSWWTLDQGEKRRLRFVCQTFVLIDYKSSMTRRFCACYPFPEGTPEEEVQRLLGAFKNQISWKEPFEKEAKGHFGNIFWYTKFTGNKGIVYFQRREICRNRVIVTCRKRNALEETGVNHGGEAVNVQIQFFFNFWKDAKDFLISDPNNPYGVSDGPSVTYELLGKDNKVRITFRRLENGEAKAQYKRIFTMKDECSKAEINSLMSRVLFYCTKIRKL